MSKVLVIGSGGREHALAWKLAQSPHVEKVYIAPGNGGGGNKLENVEIAFTDVSSLLTFAKKNKIDLTVIGQEAASEAGVVDAFEKAGLTIFGPTTKAVRIETSKVFSKNLMKQKHIPTAAYETFTDPDKARAFAKSRPRPVVIKADGLATGKGVIICQTENNIDKAVENIMIDKTFGESGTAVVVEDFLKGQEISLHALCDGQTSVLFPPSQDHKQVNDHDEGPNTGGMGVIAPVDWVKPDLLEHISAKVVQPALDGLKEQGAAFHGCLYPGLMVDEEEFKTLEFNARFGDPECEVYMRLLDADLFEVLTACAKGKLDPKTITWKPGYAVTVVIASGGYPGDYQKGLPIKGIEEAEKQPDVVVFHAGTKQESDEILTNGGRVLNVTALGDTLNQALDKAYKAVEFIHFENMHYRTDIGRRSI